MQEIRPLTLDCGVGICLPRDVSDVAKNME